MQGVAPEGRVVEVAPEGRVVGLCWANKNLKDLKNL